MAEPLADQIKRKLKAIGELYYRLVLVVGPAGAGKTAALRDVQERVGAPLINVNLDLSRQMLELTERQRALQLPRLLREITNSAVGEVVLFDNIEILFDVSLKQDPLRLLRTFPQQGRGCCMERLHWWRPHDLCYTRPSGVPPLPSPRFFGGNSGGNDMKKINGTANARQ